VDGDGTDRPLGGSTAKAAPGQVCTAACAPDPGEVVVGGGRTKRNHCRPWTRPSRPRAAGARSPVRWALQETNSGRGDTCGYGAARRRVGGHAAGHALLGLGFAFRSVRGTKARRIRPPGACRSCRWRPGPPGRPTSSCRRHPGPEKRRNRAARGSGVPRLPQPRPFDSTMRASQRPMWWRADVDRTAARRRRRAARRGGGRARTATALGRPCFARAGGGSTATSLMGE